MTRMHQEIESLTPVLEKINKGSSLDSEDTKVLNSVTEQMIRDSFDWIESEKKKQPQSALVLEQGLYTRFVNAYSAAREKNEKLRVTNTEAIKTQLNTLGAQVTEMKSAAPVNVVANQSQGPKETPIDEKTIKALKTDLEKDANIPFTIASLNKTFERFKDENNPDNRAVITSYIWSKLNNAGYIMTIKGGSIELNHATDKSGAVELQTTIQAYITAKRVNLSDLQRAMIVGPMSFGKYLGTHMVDPTLASTSGYATFIAKRLNIDISKGTPDEQVRRINSSKNGTPEERALLISYVNGGLKDYNITPEIQRQIAINKIATEVQASPVAQAVVAKVNTISAGGAKAEATQMKAADEELTWNSFLDNPMRAITKYPWTSLGLVLGSIYQFGFMKTLLGLIGGVIGYKIVDEFGGVDKLKTGKKESTPTTSAAPAPAIPAGAPKSVPKMDHTIDISKKGEYEKKLWENLKKTASITKTLDNRQEKLGTYMEFIDQNNVLDKTLGDLVYTNPHDLSIFSNKPGLPTGFPAVPAGIDSVMLKRILRVLISGVDRYLVTDLDGINHTKNYKEWVLGKTEAEKIKDDDWKKRKTKDLVTDIAKHF